MDRASVSRWRKRKPPARIDRAGGRGLALAAVLSKNAHRPRNTDGGTYRMPSSIRRSRPYTLGRVLPSNPTSSRPDALALCSPIRADAVPSAMA